MSHVEDLLVINEDGSSYEEDVDICDACPGDRWSYLHAPVVECCSPGGCPQPEEHHEFV